MKCGMWTPKTSLEIIRSSRAKTALSRGLPILLFGLALILRFAGINHDISEGKAYHPDTRKQVTAIGFYMRGSYAFWNQETDYAGYAYGSGMILAQVAKAWSWATTTVLDWMGFPNPRSEWTLEGLYLLFRGYNALLSATAVVVLWCLMRSMGSSIWGALLAAGLLALSPIDISACHYAAGDTAAAFFGLLACWFAVRVYQHGRALDYLACGAWIIFSLSAKYHGVFSAFCLLLAHGSRIGWGPILFRKPSRTRILQTSLIMVVSFLILNPAFLVRPVEQAENVRSYFETVAAFGTPEEVLEAGLFARIHFGMQHNLPVLFDVLKPFPFVLGFLVAVLSFLPSTSPTLRIVAALPLSYLLLGISTKPGCQAVYHTMITPQIFALTAMCGCFLIQSCRKFRGGLIGLVLLLSLVTFAQQLVDNRRELFMFRQADTRVYAEDWIMENLPRDFSASLPTYSQMHEVSASRAPQQGGTFAVTTRQTDPVPEHTTPIAHFHLERYALPVFRNFETIVYLPNDQQGLRAPFTHPFPAPIPSQRTRELLFPGNPAFYRDPGMFRIRHGEEQLKYLVCSNGIDRLHILVDAETTPVELTVSLNGQTTVLNSEPGRSQLFQIPMDGAFRFQEDGPLLYPLSFTSRYGNAFISLGLRDELISVAMLRAGQDGRASSGAWAPLLSHIETGSPLSPDPFAGLQAFGLSPSYLERLPYLHWSATQLQPDRGFVLRRSPKDESSLLVPDVRWPKQQSFTSPALPLAPGTYRAWVELEQALPEDTPLSRIIAVNAGFRGGLVTQSANAIRRVGNRIEATLSLSGAGAPHVKWTLLENANFSVRSAGVQADPRSSLLSIQAAAESFSRDQVLPKAICGQNFELFRRYARKTEEQKGADDAIPWAQAALACAPTREDARKDLRRLLAEQNHDCDVRLPEPAQFQNGAMLRGGCFELRDTTEQSAFHFQLDWTQWKNVPHLGAIDIWVHIRDATGKTVIQGDYPLLAALEQPSRHLYQLPPRNIALPKNLKPGPYSVFVGLWRPEEGEKIRLKNPRAFESDDTVLLHTFSK